MSVPVRALVVDASPSNAGLLAEELRRGGFEPVLRRVASREDLEQALAAGGWDIVLSDLTAETLGAFEALTILKESDIDVPFLVVSDTLGEETAIRAMKAGAQNCIPRANLARLCPILERELREAQIRRERRRAQEALRESEERFRRAALLSSDLIHECDRNSGRIAWFGDVDRILGFARDEFPRTVEAWQKVIHPEDRARVAASVARHWETGQPFFEEYRVLSRDGTVLHWHHSGTMLAASEGRPARCVGTITDISGRRQIEEALRVSEQRYRALFERNLAGVYRSTLEGRILDCNESFARIFGYASREEVLQQSASDLYRKPEDRKAALSKLLERQSLTNYEICLKRKDGSLVWVLESENLIEGPDGQLSLIEGTAIDITERKRAEEQVKHLAFHDPLTNLPNRLLFNDRLTLAVAQAHRHNQRLAVLFLDLDRFKVINDSLGHSVGDELLRQVAERVQEYVREGDTVARLGGDEFTLLVPGITAEEDAAKIAKKVCDAIHDPFWIDGRELFVTTSLGVSVYPSDGHDAETLVRNADSAMYRAKEQGRDNYQLYTPAMNAKAVERLSLESRLRQAVANDELELHFQPSST